MKLELRFDASEAILRQADENAPRGVIGIAYPEGVATLMVDQVFDPRRKPPGALIAEEVGGGIAPTSIPITVEDAVAGCVDADALSALLGYALKAAIGATGVYLAAWRFAEARSGIDLCEAVAKEIDKRVEGEKE